MSSELTERILQHLDKCEKTNTLELASVFNEDHQKIVGAVKSIQAAGDLIVVDQVSSKDFQLTDEGREVVDKGSHEAVLYELAPAEGSAQAELMKSSPNAKVGFSKAMSNGWILIDKSVNPPLVKRKVEKIEDHVRENLKAIDIGKSNEIDDKTKTDYKKRKLIQEIVIKSFDLSKGPEFTTKIEKLETDLTADMLANDMWKNLKFKPYNFNAKGVPLPCGHLHPLMKVRTEFRQIFLEMGFTEMPTNNYVESSFWNFDALFQPQNHPARDAQDTFFVSNPEKSHKFPLEYLKRVATVHSKGGYGSIGYGSDWKIEEAQKNVLRTHTTAVTARMLYKLMNDNEEFKPVKYFSIDKVFRNETLDATHLAEFHQVEGVVADRGLSLGHLIGILHEFFKKLGMTELTFKPAYNPYTEPSMEIFCFHPGLGKMIEVGNSGMFRPEMLLPMGLPPDVRVIAWGLSLERPTMIKYGINNIRELIGPKVDLKMVQESPICRMSKITPKTEGNEE
uniref:phenylalanine--tRNA ligase n=1 Tax=Tabanus bromius TaxID=304241 RepID=A0A0K8TKU5_TABBR